VERPLRLGSVPSGFAELMPAIIPEFRRRHPNVTLLIEALDVADQAHALIRAELDVGVLRAVDPLGGIRLAPIAEEPLVLALPEPHPLANKAAVRLTELRREDFIVMPRRQGPDYVDQITSACRAAGFSPRITYDPENDQIMLGLVACGLGVAILPQPIARLTVPNVVFRPLTDPTLLTTLSLAEPTHRPSPYFNVLLDLATAR